MTGSRTAASAVIIALFLALSLGMLGGEIFSYPFPPSKISPVEKYAALDIAGVLSGARRLAADIAWIQLLQYYGSPEIPLDKEAEFRISWIMTKYLMGMPIKEESCDDPACTESGHSHPDLTGGTYAGLYGYCLRVTQLDPFFSYAYLYGAGALAWNLDRPDEAIKLLEHGINSLERFSPEITKDVHQPFWQYNLYLSAIIYKKAGKFSEMTGLLESAAKQPECPNMVKAILANIYQKNGNHTGALRLWVEVHDSEDPSYAQKSLQKIAELRGLSGM